MNNTVLLHCKTVLNCLVSTQEGIKLCIPTMLFIIQTNTHVFNHLLYACGFRFMCWTRLLLICCTCMGWPGAQHTC